MELEIMCGGKDVCVLLLLLLSLYRVVQARATLADLAFIPRLILSPCVCISSLSQGAWNMALLGAAWAGGQPRPRHLARHLPGSSPGSSPATSPGHMGTALVAQCPYVDSHTSGYILFHARVNRPALRPIHMCRPIGGIPNVGCLLAFPCIE